MFMPEDVDRYNCALLNVVHTGMLVDQAWTHQIGSFQHELECSFVGGEAGVHSGIGVYGFQDGDAVFTDKDEVRFFIDDYVFTAMVLACLQLVTHHFCLFWEEDLDLPFGEFGPFEQTGPELLDGRFAGDRLVPGALNFFKHCEYIY